MGDEKEHSLTCWGMFRRFTLGNGGSECPNLINFESLDEQPTFLSFNNSTRSEIV